jgi:hypothetical protein
MSRPVEVLVQEVLGLPKAERARAIDQIIEGLDADAAVQAEIDAAWAKVAAERDAAADVDPALWLDGPEAVAQLRAEIGLE